MFLRRAGVWLVVSLVAPAAALLSAAAYYNDHRLSGGVYGRQYWLDGSIGSSLGSEIYSAKWSWGNATALVAWAQTQTKTSAEMEFYQSSVVLPACGYTQHYDNGDPVAVDSDAEDWDWGKVILTSDLGTSGSGCDNRRGALVHEIGHVMGLAEVYSGTAIMNYYLQIRKLGWTSPKADDIGGIDHLY